MLLSIIIVTFNAGKYIEECLQSITQKCNDSFEIIVMDGASKDDSVSIAKKYIKGPHKIISEKDNGIYDAMNKAVKIATGDFVYFLGADDKWILQTEEVFSILKEKNTIYYGDVEIKEKPGKVYGKRFWKYSIINRNICHQAIFFPRLIFDSYSYELKYKLLADYIMNLKLWANKKYKFEYIHKTFALYSIQGLSSTKIDENFKKDVINIIYKNYGWPGLIMKGLNPLINIFIKKVYEY